MVAIIIVIISQANQYSEHLIEINYLCIKNISSITTKGLHLCWGEWGQIDQCVSKIIYLVSNNAPILRLKPGPLTGIF